MKIVNKPWGYEKWLAVTDEYVMKEIFMKAGFQSSLQYHNYKEETNYIVEGKARVFLKPEWYEKSKGDSFHVAPHSEHRVEAITNLTMIEASTPEVDDIVRLADDYGRPDGRIESEHS